MQTAFLTFYQRVLLWNLVGNSNAPNIKEAAVLLRLIDKVRPGDLEMLDSQYTAEGGRVSWQLPGPGYGDKEIELENEEARALARAIEEAQPVRVADAVWLIRLVEDLKQPQPAAQSQPA